MCGRFAFYSPVEATAALFGVDGSLAVEPRYNIAPTQYVAAIRDDAEQNRELVTLRWGLVPFWAKDPAIGNKMINARAETVAEKPSYRNAFKHRRCVVLADGFYEWHRHGDIKVPHFISQKSNEPFGLAGLWESWNNKETGESMHSTTLITTAANDFMKPLHHRMPVILRPETASEWLAGRPGFLDGVNQRMPALQAWPVSRTVNNARNQGAELIVPAGDLLD